MDRAYLHIRAISGHEESVMKRLNKMPTVKKVSYVVSVVPWNIVAELEGPYNDIGATHLKVRDFSEISDSQLNCVAYTVFQKK